MGTTSHDPRWLAFGLLVLGLVLVIYGGLAEWLAFGDYYGKRELWPFTYEVGVWMAVPLVALASGIVFAMAVGARRNYVPPPAVLFVLSIIGVIALLCLIHAIAHASNLTVEQRVATPDDRWRAFTYRTQQVKFSVAPWLALIGLAAAIASTTWLGWISRGVRLRAARELDRANLEQAKLAGDVVPSADAQVTEREADVPRL